MTRKYETPEAGTKVGNFSFISEILKIYSGLKKTRVWTVECQCSKIIELPMYRVFTQHSCGCMGLGQFHRKYTFYSELPSSYYCDIRKTAKRRNIKFNLSIDDLYNTLVKQNFKCALTGLEIGFIKNKIKPKYKASLDRIDSTKGYTIDNIQWVWSVVNTMKSNLTEEKLVEICQLIINQKSKFL